MIRRTSFFIAVLIALTCFFSTSMAGDFVPIREYQELADSPFPDFGIGDNLIVENFEADQVAGVSYTASGTLRVGSGFSVSADGASGNALEIFPTGCTVSFPQQCPATLSINFDQESFGQLPNYFGFVWTDAVRASADDVHPWARVNVTDSEGVVTGNLINELPIEDTLADAFADDTLIGFVNDRGIQQVDITIVTSGRPGGGHFAIDHLQFGVAALAGDVDKDGDVDFADFVVLSREFGNEDTEWRTGDFNFDQKTEFGDFLDLSNNFGKKHDFGVPAGGISSVPEPSSATIVALLVVCLGGTLRRQQRRRG